MEQGIHYRKLQWITEMNKVLCFSAAWGSLGIESGRDCNAFDVLTRTGKGQVDNAINGPVS